MDVQDKTPLSADAKRCKRLRTTAAARLTTYRNRAIAILFKPRDETSVAALEEALDVFDHLYGELTVCHEALCEELTDEQWPHEEDLFQRHLKLAMEFRQKCNAWLNPTTSDEASTADRIPAASVGKDAAMTADEAALDTSAADHRRRSTVLPQESGRTDVPTGFPEHLVTDDRRLTEDPPMADVPCSVTTVADRLPAVTPQARSLLLPSSQSPLLPPRHAQLSPAAAPFVPRRTTDDSVPRPVSDLVIPVAASNTDMYVPRGRSGTPMSLSPSCMANPGSSRLNVSHEPTRNVCSPQAYLNANDPDLNVSFPDDCMPQGQLGQRAPPCHSPLHAFTDPLLTALSLPKPDLIPFSGNVAEYQLFISSFDSRIGNRLSSPIDKLHYLHQFLRGEARELISGCFHLFDSGYAEARRLLDREYGDPYKTSCEFVRQISDCAAIKSGDPRALRKFAMLLNKCLQAMRHVSHMNVLDHPSTMLTAVRKLPSYLQNKWLERVYDISHYATPNFAQLVEFVVRASDVANDPVYGKHSVARAEPSQSESRPKKLTNLAASAKPDVRTCDCCGQKGHDAPGQCPTFKAKSAEERMELKALNRCFGCLGQGHYVNRCRNRMECRKCFKKHPTCLHVDGFTMPNRAPVKRAPEHNVAAIDTDFQTESADPAAEIEEASGTCTACKDVDGCVDACTTDTKGCKSTTFHPVIPVKISQSNGKQVTVYCLYDSGSSGCFVSDRLCDEMNLSTTDTQLRLRTMHGSEVSRVRAVNDLIVSDLNGENEIRLPRAFSCSEIPVELGCIPTPSQLNAYPCFDEVAPNLPPTLNRESVDLLIGTNCPAALEPLEVASSASCPLIAVRLRHGWTIMGPMSSNTNCSTSHSFRVIHKEVMTPTPFRNSLKQSSTNAPQIPMTSPCLLKKKDFFNSSTPIPSL
jgi:hypothetical protein